MNSEANAIAFVEIFQLCVMLVNDIWNEALAVVAPTGRENEVALWANEPQVTFRGQIANHATTFWR